MKTKHFIITLLALLTSITASAYTWTDANGTEWNFTTSGSNATLYGYDTTPCIYGTIPADLIIPTTVYIGETPYTVTSIGEYAFYDCYSLTSINIPGGVTSIGQGAFMYCSGLTSITIPDRVASIGKEAFMYCSGLTSISIPNNVTSIGEGAFKGCRGLTSIIISENITRIESYAFYSCTSLVSITIPDGVTYIGAHAFGSCSSLNSVTIPESVTKIDIHAFADCSSLASVAIPSSVTSLCNGAFQNCSSLTSINIPEGITDDLSVTFWGCSQLSSVRIPSSITEIGYGAFYGCSSLTSVIIPEGVTEIENGAFQDCSSLTSVTIPSSVTSIVINAFRGCSNLTSVFCSIKTPPYVSSEVFPTYANITLYVPDGYKSAYQNEYYWCGFKEIIELKPVNVGTTGYATYCSPVDLDFSYVSGIKAYIASGFNPTTGKLVLTRVTEVPAGEGLYIVGTEGSYIIPGTTTAMVLSNLLKGVTTATTIYPTEGDYTNFILANSSSHGVGFYTLSETGEIAAGKAYLQLPTSSVSNVKAITFAFEDDSETGISETKEVREVKEVYNLQGQRVNQPKHGLYIINGKKVIIK